MEAARGGGPLPQCLNDPKGSHEANQHPTVQNFAPEAQKIEPAQ